MAVELKLNSFKKFDESGLMLLTGEYDEIKYLNEAAKERGVCEITILRNNQNQIKAFGLVCKDELDG